MIKIKELSKSYNNENILNNINITIKPGEIYGIIGQSGAGKSTLLRCINGLEEIDSGSLIVNGIELNNIKKKPLRHLRKKIGIIFQDFALLNQKTVYENIALPLKCWKYDNNYINRKVTSLLELVGLSHKITALPNELSGGQKQRIAIARALSLEPSILLCDEATSALDPKTTKNILNLIADINEKMNITVVIVTHEMNVIKEICDRVSLIADGTITAEGPLESVLLSHSIAYEDLIGKQDILAPLKTSVIKIYIQSSDYSRSIIWELIKNADIKLTILASDIQQYRKKSFGYITLAVPDSDLIKTINYCNSNNILFEVEKEA